MVFYHGDLLVISKVFFYNFYKLILCIFVKNHKKKKEVYTIFNEVTSYEAKARLSSKGKESLSDDMERNCI